MLHSTSPIRTGLSPQDDGGCPAFPTSYFDLSVSDSGCLETVRYKV